LYVTKAGEAFLNQLFETLAQTEDAVLHQLSGPELHILNELLDRMYSACARETPDPV